MNLSINQKIGAAVSFDDEYPIHSICRVLNLNRSTYYHNKYRKPKVTMIEKDDEKYNPIIKAIFEDSKGRLGGRKIRRIMMKDNNTISEKRISRLMKEMNLVPNKPNEDYKNYHKRKYSYKPNIISKSEHYPEPNKIWVSDITYLKLNKKHHYLFVIIDLYSRMVIGYSVVEILEAKELMGLIKHTFMKRGNPNNLTFHSDQGIQYTSYIFKTYLKDNSIEQSFSKKGCPYDNAVCESIFRD